MYRKIGVFAVMAAGWLATANLAHAQFGGVVGVPGNPLRVPPGMNQAQYLASVRAYARTAATTPPWLNGYNRGFGAGPVVNPNPAAPFNPYSPLYGGGASALTNPYTPIGAGAGAGVVNPYTPAGISPYGWYGGVDPFNPYNPYYNPWGGVLSGTADIVRAYGSQMQSAEQARIMREQANQAKLDTIRQRFDLEMYIKANTPTFTEEQARIAALTLRRIQNNATPGEILSGRSLNVLLDDLRKFPGKKVTTDLPPLPENVLVAINITSSTGSLGMLRDSKIPAWPTALQEVFSPTELKKIELQFLTQLNAAEGKGMVDPNVLKELRTKIDKAREELGNRINDIPTSEYLNGKRFLNDLDQARIALERGEAKHQLEYMKWARTSPRSPQDLADYLTSRGLKIAASTLTDEAGYRAAHSALAALDIQMNTQFAAAEPEPKE